MGQVEVNRTRYHYHHMLKVMTLYHTPYRHTSLVYVCIHCPVSAIILSKDKSACYRKSQVDQEQGCWCLFLDGPLWSMFCSNACASVIVGCDSSCQSKPSKGPRWKIWKKINWITKQLVWLFSSQAFDKSLNCWISKPKHWRTDFNWSQNGK